MDSDSAIKHVMLALEDVSRFHRSFKGYTLIKSDGQEEDRPYSISRTVLKDLENLVGLAVCISDDNLEAALARVCEMPTDLRDHLNEDFLEFVKYV